MNHQVGPETAAHLDSILAAEQAAGRLPSVTAGVVRDGVLVWTGARGGAVGVERRHRPDADTQYRIGSITKTMTAVLVLQLRDEGRLDLSDPLGKHLPGVAYEDRTLRDLLSHSSGIPAEPAGEWWERSQGVSFGELTAALQQHDAVLPTRQQYHYSNLAYALLGQVVAQLRELSWWEAATRYLLQPLGMRRTTYLPHTPHAEGLSVHPYAGTLTPEPRNDADAMAPAGQLWSTVTDLATLAGFLLAPDPAVLAPETVAEMATPQSGSPEDGMSTGYGLGLRLLPFDDGATLIGHTGSMPGFLAGLLVDSQTQTGAVCLSNATTGLRCEGLPTALVRTMTAHEPRPCPEWLPTTTVPHDVADILGVWHWGNTAMVLSYDGRELAFARPGTTGEGYRYEFIGPDTYRGVTGYHTGETLHVVRRADGSVSHLECATFIYTRVPYDPEAPIPGR